MKLILILMFFIPMILFFIKLIGGILWCLKVKLLII
jgi:hypothetical protein